MTYKEATDKLQNYYSALYKADPSKDLSSIIDDTKNKFFY